jgi:hypothetical protein
VRFIAWINKLSEPQITQIKMITQINAIRGSEIMSKVCNQRMMLEISSGGWNVPGEFISAIRVICVICGYQRFRRYYRIPAEERCRKGAG